MAPRPTPDRRVARIAAGQSGAFTRRAALAAGMTPGMVRHRLVTGRWRRLARGVYAIAGAPDTPEQRAIAACLASGPGAVLSHRSAGRVWGLPGCEALGTSRRLTRPTASYAAATEPAAANPAATAPAATAPPFTGPDVEVVVPHRTGRRHNPLARVHRSRRLAAVDCTTKGGLPVTTPARTVIDLAGEPPSYQRVRTSPAGQAQPICSQVDEAVASGLLLLDRLRRRAQAVCGRGRRGTRVLRAILRTWGDAGRVDSRVEIDLERWLRSAGLGGLAQHAVTVDGERFVIDHAWPTARVGLELDSYRWHGTPDGRRRTSRRVARLRAQGWDMHSVTPEQVAARDPYVTAALHLALARRGPGAGPD